MKKDKLGRWDIHIMLPAKLTQRLENYLEKTFGGSQGKSLIIKKAISDYLDKMGAKK